MAKICKSCGHGKPIDQFYKHPGMKDGRLNKCAECIKVEVKENRRKKIDYYKSYDNARASRPDRVEARRKYSETSSGKRATAAAKTRYIERNPVKRAVHIITGNAIKSGRLVKQACEVCGSDIVHAHHDDYAYPLQVRWLCPEHHAEWHKTNRAMLQGKVFEDAA